MSSESAEPYDESLMIHRFIEEYQDSYASVVSFYRKYKSSRDPIIQSSIKSIIEFIQKEFEAKCKIQKLETRGLISSTSSSRTFLRLRLIREYQSLSDCIKTLVVPEPNWMRIDELIDIRKRVAEIIETRKMDKQEFIAFRASIPMRYEYYNLRSTLDYGTLVL